MNKFENGESNTDQLVIINNNILSINEKIVHIINLLSKTNIIIDKENKKIDKDDKFETTKLDKNIKVTSQKEEFIYSHIIPNLKVGRIIKQEFRYDWNQSNDKEEDS